MGLVGAICGGLALVAASLVVAEVVVAALVTAAWALVAALVQVVGRPEGVLVVVLEGWVTEALVGVLVGQAGGPVQRQRPHSWLAACKPCPSVAAGCSAHPLPDHCL